MVAQGLEMGSEGTGVEKVKRADKKREVTLEKARGCKRGKTEGTQQEKTPLMLDLCN